MAKRVYELAKELNVSSKELMNLAKKNNIVFNSHMASITDEQEKVLRNNFMKKNNNQNKVKNQSGDTKKIVKKKVVHHFIKNKKNNDHRRTNFNRHNDLHGEGRILNLDNPRKNNRPQRKQVTKNIDDLNHKKTQSNNINLQHENSKGERKKEPIVDKKKFNNSNKKFKHDDSKNSTLMTSMPKPDLNKSSKSSEEKKSDKNKNQSRDRKKEYTNNHEETPYKRQKKTKFNKKQQKIKQKQEAKEAAAKPVRKEKPLPDVLVYEEGMNAQELGKLLHREPTEIIKKLFMLGVAVNQNQSLDKDTIEILAADYGIDAKEKEHEDIADIDKFFEQNEEDDNGNLVSRPPVVTIMGHVDHGKTTLLDQLRNSHITAGEAGGITQKIGAYQVNVKGKKITFIDTPGHAAFTAMRARGANITDITILVVAADDGVMPQTLEAIHHAQAAKTPIIVAINKIDKPGANPDHVIEQLAEHNLVPEDWGGDTIFVNISAKQNKNLDELLDMVLLQAEMMELKANPDKRAIGSVVEARLDKGRGPVATVLVQGGTLHIGDPIVIGNTYGKIRTMNDDHHRAVKKATPSMPVEITGMNDVPAAGDKFVVFEDEKSARLAGEERAKRALLAERSRTSHVTVDNLFDTMKQADMKEVPVIIKADVQGSVEALANSFNKIQVDGVRVNIVHQAVGAINESDVTLAEASNAIIVGFNVRPTAQAKSQAESSGVDIRLHNVIYNAIDEIESAMKGMLEPVYKEEVTGQVEVLELYKVSKVGTVVGGMVTEGYITNDAGVRLIRDGVVVYEGKLGSLQRYKDAVKEVKAGLNLGLTIANYNDIKVGDMIEAFVMKEVPVE